MHLRWRSSELTYMLYADKNKYRTYPRANPLICTALDYVVM